jgi:hypothetical protein
LAPALALAGLALIFVVGPDGSDGLFTSAMGCIVRDAARDRKRESTTFFARRKR